MPGISCMACMAGARLLSHPPRRSDPRGVPREGEGGEWVLSTPPWARGSLTYIILDKSSKAWYCVGMATTTTRSKRGGHRLLVLVEWVDSHSGKGWRPLDEIAEGAGPVYCR